MSEKKFFKKCLKCGSLEFNKNIIYEIIYSKKLYGGKYKPFMNASVLFLDSKINYEIEIQFLDERIEKNNEQICKDCEIYYLKHYGLYKVKNVIK